MLISDFLHFNLNKAQGWAIGLGSHGIFVPGHKYRDLELILVGLGQISLGQSRDKNLWNSQIPSFGTILDSGPIGFWSPMGLMGISWNL